MQFRVIPTLARGAYQLTQRRFIYLQFSSPATTMAPPVQAANRNKRKRKRKTVEFSSSSSSSSGSDDEVAPTPAPAPEPESASSTVSSDDSDSSDSDSDDAPPTLRRQAAAVTAQLQAVANDAQAPRQARASSRSPSPRPTEIPSFLPPRTADNEKEREEKDKVLKERFRKLWMSTVADEFKGDLEEIRKVSYRPKYPNTVGTNFVLSLGTGVNSVPAGYAHRQLGFCRGEFPFQLTDRRRSRRQRNGASSRSRRPGEGSSCLGRTHAISFILYFYQHLQSRLAASSISCFHLRCISILSRNILYLASSNFLSRGLAPGSTFFPGRVISTIISQRRSFSA